MKIPLMFLCSTIFQLNFSFSSFSQSIVFFKPSIYYREFTAAVAPVLRMNQGDTVSTESVDATGVDKTGTKVTERGNPLTGPFYIEQAAPGDVVAVTITSLSLNRDYATTLNALIPKMMEKKNAMRTWRSAKLVKWTLDTINMRGTAAPQFERLKGLSLPLHPFLGCVGVAPEGSKGLSSGGTGECGGNIDFKYVAKGATVYLPVFHPGAMLFLGDGHAAQGDGELNGDALETSMRFSFTVRVIKQAATVLPTPMIEDADYFMVLGMAKTLDEAMRAVTMKFSAWLQLEYGFNQQEASQVIGPAVEYRIPKVAATQVEVVAMLRKDLFKGVKKISDNK
jgi:amidase